DFAVGIRGYYRDKDFDLVPYTTLPGDKDREVQWDPQRQVWQPILHSDLAPKLQQLSEHHPEGFLTMRLLKLWNEALPKIRGGKAPLVSLHIPLLQLAADQPCESPQCRLLASMRFIRDTWRAKALDSSALLEVRAEPHLARMAAKYAAEKGMEGFDELIDQSIGILEGACAEGGADKRAAERVISAACSLFGLRNSSS
ncbi:unnamed protein product, partial [Effrenium voratum]